MSSNIKIPKVCQFCGSDFIARTTTTQFCGDPCAKKAYKKRMRDKKIQAVEPLAIQRQEFNQDQLRDKDFLSIAEVSKLLGASRMTLYRQIKQGTIKAGKIGRRTIIARAEIEKIFR